MAVQFTPRLGNRRQRTGPGFTPIHSLCCARSQDLSRNHSICPPDSQFSDLDSQSRSQFPRAAAPRFVLGVMPPNQWDDDVGRDHSLFHSSQHPPWVSRSTVLRPRFTPSITLPFATCPRGKKTTSYHVRCFRASFSLHVRAHCCQNVGGGRGSYCVCDMR